MFTTTVVVAPSVVNELISTSTPKRKLTVSDNPPNILKDRYNVEESDLEEIVYHKNMWFKKSFLENSRLFEDRMELVLINNYKN